MAKIELSNIAHTYEPDADEPTYALKSLNLVWKDGGTYALLGPSGCGKTTMLNIISGLIHPSQGRILFDGVDFTLLPTSRRNIAQVFQFPVIYTLMSVEENLSFPLVCRHMPRAERARKVREVAELLNLTDKLKRPARKLAADEKQLISLGRGLVRNDVTALLMDEPLTVIDPQLKFEIRRKLKRINELYGLTMIYVTHDQTEAMTFADTIVVMNDGELIQSGTPQELYDRPETTYVGYFIGSPAMNFIPCTPVGDRLQTPGGSVPIPRNVSIPAGVEDLKIGIRPRNVGFSDSKEGKGIKGQVELVQELGNARVVTVRMQNEKVKIKLHPGTVIPSGEVGLDLPEDRICLYADDVLIGQNS
ncbi:MAG: ABC transporter ATP-binding protein [Deltaproteobacteria bacterium]|nr:ABC transporter ATP-binding protein [Deltaproteobacteria bacterium]